MKQFVGKHMNAARTLMLSFMGPPAQSIYHRPKGSKWTRKTGRFYDPRLDGINKARVQREKRERRIAELNNAN